MKKLISLYVKGGDNDAGYYYRFHQFFREMDISVRRHQMYSDYVYSNYIPTFNRPAYIKVFLWIYQVIRVFFQIVKDYFDRPDVLVISRRLVSRWSPQIFNLLLTRISRRGTKVLWDFDDNIIASRECDGRAFSTYCKVASTIIVASKELKYILPEIYRNKVIYLPSTDGDLVKFFNNETKEERNSSYLKEIRIIWLGTQVSLKHVESIIPLLEKAGEELKAIGKRLVLTIVCDKGINKQSQLVTIRNVTWTREAAINELKKAHIGIMPLEVNEFTKGKGGFKLIQYLSIGLPVIATSVGINEMIVSENVGFLAKELNDIVWKDGVIALSMDINKWKEYSENAIAEYLKDYSAEYNLKEWENLIGAN